MSNKATAITSQTLVKQPCVRQSNSHYFTGSGKATMCPTKQQPLLHRLWSSNHVSDKATTITSQTLVKQPYVWQSNSHYFTDSSKATICPTKQQVVSPGVLFRAVQVLSLCLACAPSRFGGGRWVGGTTVCFHLKKTLLIYWKSLLILWQVFKLDLYALKKKKLLF